MAILSIEVPDAQAPKAYRFLCSLTMPPTRPADNAHARAALSWFIKNGVRAEDAEAARAAAEESVTPIEVK